MNVLIVIQEYLDDWKSIAVCEFYHVKIIVTENVNHLQKILPNNNTQLTLLPAFSCIIDSVGLTIDTYKQYTISVVYTQMCISFLAPKPRFLFAMYVFTPLDSTVWLYLSLGTLVLIFVLYFCALVYRKLYSTYPSRYVHFLICINDILRILLQIVASLWIFVSYMIGVTSLLTQPIHSKPINTLEDMVTENIHWGFMFKSFGNMNESTLYKIGLLYDNPDNNEVRNKRLRTGQYAAMMKIIGNNFIIDTETFNEFFKPDVQNSLRALQECVFNYNFILKLRRNSPLKHILDRRIYQILESGLYSYWENEMKATLNLTDMFQYFTMTGDETYNKESPLTIRRIQGLFYLLFTGLSLSIIVFIIEILYNIVLRK